MTEKPIKTQLDRANDKLKELEPDIGEDDKRKCKEAFQISYSTLWRYLHCQGTNPNLAIEILTYLSNLIAEKEAKLQSVT